MKNLVLLFAVAVLSAATFAGCAKPAAQPAENSQAAIDASKTISDMKAQSQYLLDQANGFLASQRFEDAVNTAKYVLNLDQQEYIDQAKAIIERAQAELKKFAEQKAEEVKGAAEGKMQEIKGAIGSLGK